jgi:TM2 domain-containing membrane protein YozV
MGWGTFIAGQTARYLRRQNTKHKRTSAREAEQITEDLENTIPKYFQKSRTFAEKNKEKSAWVLLTLLITSGIVGGHRFYLGKTFSAFLYMFSFALFGSGLIYDFFMTVTGNLKDRGGRKVRFRKSTPSINTADSV